MAVFYPYICKNKAIVRANGSQSVPPGAWTHVCNVLFYV